MTTFLAALAGGAIGVLLAWVARLTVVGRDVRAHDCTVAVLDEDLESWIADATVTLHRALSGVTAAMTADPVTHEACNLHWSGHHALEVARVKEAALEAYRNEERRARREVAEIHAQEQWSHRFYRRWRRKSAIGLQTPERAREILDRWAAPVTRHLSLETDPPYQIDDPRERTLDSTIAYLDANEKALV